MCSRPFARTETSSSGMIPKKTMFESRRGGMCIDTLHHFQQGLVRRGHLRQKRVIPLAKQIDCRTGVLLRQVLHTELSHRRGHVNCLRTVEWIEHRGRGLLLLVGQCSTESLRSFQEPATWPGHRLFLCFFVSLFLCFFWFLCFFAFFLFLFFFAPLFLCFVSLFICLFVYLLHPTAHNTHD